MGSRRRSREFALQALYQADLSGSPVTASFSTLWSGVLEGDGLSDDPRPPESDEVEFAQRLAFGVEANRDRIDAMIEESSINWRVGRMPVVDRNILRIAAYELIECPDIPGTVSINESVELAKKFGAAESRAFVNGIVDKLARTLNRLEPGHAPSARKRTEQ